MCADVVEVAATFGGGTGEAVPGGSNALASASASGGGTDELEGDDVCLDTIGEAAIAASSFSGSSSAASIATGASAFGANFSARNTAGRGPSSASSSNAPASQPVTVNYKTLSFAEKVEKLEANQLLRRNIDSMQSVLAAPRALDLGVALQALRHDQNRAKEDSMRSFMRQHASAAIKNGYAADADRVETMNLPTAKASRAYVLKTMSERGVTVIPITHSLSNGEAPVTSHHIPLVSSLRMVLEDARIPEGSIGRITPSIEGGPSWMPPQSTSLVDPGDVLWMGDLPLVREGFSAAISAAAASWFWEPLRHICKTRGVQLDVFAMPLLGSHDETLIGTQDTADPVLTQIIAARGGFATSTDSIFCRGFINKPPIGECPTPAARARTLEVWHRQLYLAFASELDQYFDGMPLLMSRVPGLERGSQPNTIYLALPYSVAMCLDWMALLSSAHRKKESCCLCSIRKCQLHEPSPDVIRLKSVEDKLTELWSLYAEGCKRLALEPAGSAAVKNMKKEMEQQRATLEQFGFSVELPNPWYMRSSPPPCGSFFSVHVEFNITPSQLSPSIAAAPPQLSPSIFRSRLAIAAEMPLEAIHFRQHSPSSFGAQFLVPIPSNHPLAIASAHNALLHNLNEMLRSTAGIPFVLAASPTIQWIRGPQFGLVPWSVNKMEFLRRIPIDLLHVGAQGMYQHVRKGTIALVKDQPTSAWGKDGSDAVRNLDRYVKEALPFTDNLEVITSFKTRGVLKQGSLTGLDSRALHAHILSSLSATDVLFDPDERFKVILVLELLEHIEEQSAHAPFHAAALPADFIARQQLIHSTAKVFMTACNDVLGEYQASGFDISKIHALLEASEWVGIYASLKWVSMHLFEAFHKLVKSMARGKTNNKNVGFTLCNTYIARIGLLNVVPRLLGQAPLTLPSCAPLVELDTFKRGDCAALISPAELRVIAKECTGKNFSDATAASLDPTFSVTWHSQAHLTRSCLPFLKVCDAALNPDVHVIRPCAMDAALRPLRPFFPLGDELGAHSSAEYLKKGALYLTRGFFTSSANPQRIFVYVQRYSDYIDGSPDATASPYLFRVRRKLSDSFEILLLENVYDTVPVAYFRVAGVPPSMRDITVRPFQRQIN